jgi:hypothetical protein
VVAAVLLVRVGLLHATLTLEITTMTDDKIALRERHRRAYRSGGRLGTAVKVSPRRAIKQ